MADSDGEYVKLKESFKDIMDTFNLEGKSQSQIMGNGSLYKCDLLAEAVMELIGVCEKTFNMYDMKYLSPTSNTVDDIVQKVTNAISNLVPSLVNDVISSKDSGSNLAGSSNPEIVENDKHIIIVEDKDDSTKTYE